KWFCPGGSLCVKDVFAKNFLVPGEIPLAARSHRFFGNTLLEAGHLIGRAFGMGPLGFLGNCVAALTDRFDRALLYATHVHETVPDLNGCETSVGHLCVLELLGQKSAF